VGHSKPAGNIQSDAVLVAVAERGGAAGVVCDSVSLAQPARKPMALQNAKTSVSFLATRTEIE
jgi:hypothetical protein